MNSIGSTTDLPLFADTFQFGHNSSCRRRVEQQNVTWCAVDIRRHLSKLFWISFALVWSTIRSYFLGTGGSFFWIDSYAIMHIGLSLRPCVQSDPRRRWTRAIYKVAVVFMGVPKLTFQDQNKCNVVAPYPNRGNLFQAEYCCLSNL
jgi:hypothetical protein